MIAVEKKKPGLAALVIGMGKPKAKAGDDEGEDEGYGEDFDEAAGEAYDAQKSGDREAYVEALKAAIMSCK